MNEVLIFMSFQTVPIGLVDVKDRKSNALYIGLSTGLAILVYKDHHPLHLNRSCYTPHVRAKLGSLTQWWVTHRRKSIFCTY